MVATAAMKVERLLEIGKELQYYAQLFGKLINGEHFYHLQYTIGGILDINTNGFVR